jgi:hypothetical protein
MDKEYVVVDTVGRNVLDGPFKSHMEAEASLKALMLSRPNKKRFKIKWVSGN